MVWLVGHQIMRIVMLTHPLVHSKLSADTVERVLGCAMTWAHKSTRTI